MVSVFSIDLTILGCIKTPSFAIALTDVIICKGVIVNLCPNDIVASSTGPTLSISWNVPTASPEVAIPVLLNKPNASKYLYIVSFPIFAPSCINAGLHECSNASLND